MFCETLLTSGKGFFVQDANMAAGKSGQKFIMLLLLQEMKRQQEGLVSRERQRHRSWRQ